MTTFRYPVGWNSARDPGERPRIEEFSWLERCCVTTRVYWLKIHWATPPWMTDAHWAQMRAIYEGANPAFEHVDHIVPLKHPLVCGLHVPWNLQVVPARDNLNKSNNWWPDCPDHLCPEKNATLDLVGAPEPYQLRIEAHDYRHIPDARGAGRAGNIDLVENEAAEGSGQQLSLGV